MFDSTKESLRTLLEHVRERKLQLPDFQRDWVWDENGIHSLLVSIVRGFPVGAILTLEAGGEVKFLPRPLATIEANGTLPLEFLLDGQQRLTSLVQSLTGDAPVVTKTAKGELVERRFFADLRLAAQPDSDPADWIVMTRGDGRETSDFGRKIDRDYSTEAKQFEEHVFPLSRVFREHDWLYGYKNHWHERGQDVHDTDQALFRNVIRPIHRYEMPIIRLAKNNSREAICTVFEKVNTGGKKLDAFELLTAVYAAEEFNLRSDWLGTNKETGRLDRVRGLDKRRDIYAHLASTDFLQTCTALSTMDRRKAAEAQGRTGKDLPPITIRRDAMLGLPLTEYKRLANSVEEGFLQAKKFLSARKIIWFKDVPYPSQAITLAAVLSRLSPAERTATSNDRLDHWFWSSVFGELYAGSVETRIARDIPELLMWIRDAEPGVATIGDAVFQIERLETLRSRLAAAYKALSARLMLSGARDFVSGEPFEIMTYFDQQVDIHHIFPRAWCKDNDIPASTYDSIINKSPLSKLTNIRIGGDAPSVYLKRIEDRDKVEPAVLDEILRSHLIEPKFLRADDFKGFWNARREALAGLVESAMRKPVVRLGHTAAARALRLRRRGRAGGGGMSGDKTPIGTITHDEKRANIPPAELEPVLSDDDRKPIRLAFERRNRDLDPQLVWRGKDPDQAELTVNAPPIYLQEQVHPKALIDDLRNAREKAEDLFGHFGLTEQDREAEIEFYRHTRKWSNRMILGDALQVMSSLAEREGLKGQVQAIYIDPPYGIRFNSNFQWSTTSRDVKDGKLDHLTREPEQVKAFRDTWRDGIHSYLSYLRDRLTVARELLSERGSCFVQIGDENVHRVRALMDEIFGRR